MKIKSNQIYYTVQSIRWGVNSNVHRTIEFIDKMCAISYYKEKRQEYMNCNEQCNRMYRLAKVQNGQSITLACCGYGVMDNFSFADDEPII